MHASIATKLLPVSPWLRRVERLISGWRARRAPAAAGCAHDADAHAAAAEAQEAPQGCGWFDSSHDLQQGLRVQEHLDAESLVRELPLAAWLELQLSGWRVATPAVASAVFVRAT